MLSSRLLSVASELRDFPKVLPIAEQERLMDNCVKGLENCINLRSCTWTRHGSLNEPIIKSLQHCPTLQEIEINGHHEKYYDPYLLVALHGLHKISLIMPTRDVVHLLPAWCQNNRNTLRSLSLICKVSVSAIDLQGSSDNKSALVFSCNDRRSTRACFSIPFTFRRAQSGWMLQTHACRGLDIIIS